MDGLDTLADALPVQRFATFLRDQLQQPLLLTGIGNAWKANLFHCEPLISGGIPQLEERLRGLMQALILGRSCFRGWRWLSRNLDTQSSPERQQSGRCAQSPPQ